MTKEFEIKLKGHESFYIREGWLRKGLCGIKGNEYLFADNIEAIDKLGVGSNMVKSIRYWLQSVNLTVEERGDGGKRKQFPTKDFGEIILKEDPYFEDLGTLYLLHYNLVTNSSLATSWYLFFNRISATEMTKEGMKLALIQQIENIDPGAKYSEKSIIDDCRCIIKTYSIDESDSEDPEDNMICPFTELGLLNKIKRKGNEELIVKLIPSKKKLDRLIILYVIVDNLEKKHENITTINRLIEDDSNIGKVFNLDKNSINEYLDILQQERYLSITRTAGLNTISLRDNSIQTKDILNKYYAEL